MNGEFIFGYLWAWYILGAGVIRSALARRISIKASKNELKLNVNGMNITWRSD